MSDLFFHRLRERLDPRRSEDERSVATAQRQCGRWLALQRLRAGITTDQAATQSGVAHDIVQLLEAGLAEERDACDGCWRDLAGLITVARDDAVFIRAAMATVLSATPCDAQARARINADLQLAPPQREHLIG